MRTLSISILLTFLLLSSAAAQPITWQNITANYSLPAGVSVFAGTRAAPALKIWYLDVDLNNTKLAVRPYMAGTSQTLPGFTAAVGAYAAVNGGYFGGGIPYSAVVYPNEVKAANVQSVTRNGLTYPVIRSFFGMKKDRNLSVDWIYQFGNAVTDLYTFPQPLPYVNNDPSPRPAPSKSNGTVFADLLTGIGGGPMLIRNDSIKITYAQELMWGSGVGETNNDPRTAVGYTANKHVIIIVADGRQTASEGVSLTELASIMKGLGCIGAMNLDGGGSTQMAVPNQYINTPSESRPVPAILAVVHADSLNLPKEPLFRRIIDTGDTNATALGGGWFESANPGYWSTTKAQLHPIGTGTGKYEFRPHLPAKAVYSVYGWWVSSSNRATDVPFIIERSGGTDTVRVDQVANGSSWKLIGTYEFTGTASDKVTISDAAKTNNYVVADAVKFESVDPNVLTGIRSLPASAAPSEFTLEQNFPNPFNPETTISFTVPDAPSPVPVSLTVQDLVGRTVTTLVKVNLDKGSYQYRWNAAGLPSGVYFCRLQAGSLVSVKRMMLLK